MSGLKPRPWQIEDARAVRRRGKFMIRHPMGMGKSEIATLAVAMIGDDRGNLPELPCLIACPIRSITDWEEHLQREFPGDRIIVAAELSPEEKREALAEPAKWYIVNHAMLAVPSKRKQNARTRKGLAPSARNYYDMPKGLRAFVIDESHEKGLGRHSDAWVGAKKVADAIKTGHGLVIPMTGTPIRKTGDDIWSQLRLIDKSLTSYWRFVDEHCIIEETPWSRNVIGSRDSLRVELARRSVTRTYAEVGMSLPNVVPHQHRVRLMPKTRELYDRLKNDLRDEYDNPVFSAGAALSKLRKLTATDANKIAMLVDIVKDLDQYLIFTYHHEVSDMLKAQLEGQCGHETTIIDGRLDGRHRADTAKRASKIIGGIDALASTLDLSHHRHIIWYEETYEPGTMDNARARVQRWRKTGDEAPISEHYVYCDRTVDSRIHALAEGRGIDMHMVTDKRLLDEELFR